EDTEQARDRRDHLPQAALPLRDGRGLGAAGGPRAAPGWNQPHGAAAPADARRGSPRGPDRRSGVRAVGRTPYLRRKNPTGGASPEGGEAAMAGLRGRRVEYVPIRPGGPEETTNGHCAYDGPGEDEEGGRVLEDEKLLAAAGPAAETLALGHSGLESRVPEL